MLKDQIKEIFSRFKEIEELLESREELIDKLKKHKQNKIQLVYYEIRFIYTMSKLQDKILATCKQTLATFTNTVLKELGDCPVKKELINKYDKTNKTKGTN